MECESMTCQKGIEVYGDEWFMTAGLMGLKRLLDNEVQMTPGGLIIKESILEELPRKYFAYFLSEYSVAKRDCKRMENNLESIERKPDSVRERMTDIRKTANDQLKKVNKYFSDREECEQLKGIVSQMKELKNTEQLDLMKKLVRDYCGIMETQYIDEKLTLNFVKALIISPYYGQPSFLNVAFQGNKEEHIERMRKDFVEPALKELNFYHIIQNNKWDEVIKFLEKHKSIQPYKKLYKEAKTMYSTEEFRQWMKEAVVSCSFIEEIPAVMGFEEMMFAPLGLSAANAFNFFWEGNKRRLDPMCALARLILFMIPAGVAIYGKKFITNNGMEYKQFAGLVLQDLNFEENCKANNTYRTKKKKDSSFREIILSLLGEKKTEAELSKSSYLFIEFHSDIQMKKTIMDYYHMPQYAVNYFVKYSDNLRALKVIEYQDEFVVSVLHGIDPKQTLFKCVKKSIENNFHAYGAFVMARERNRIEMLQKQKGEGEMEEQDKRLMAIFNRGKEIRIKMLHTEQNSDGKGPYRASSAKKIEAIAYRLLNAVKAGNEEEFMDAVFRLHIAEGKPMSPIFLDIVKEEGLDFGAIGSAFITGLLVDTEYKSNKQEEKADE